MKLPYAPLDLHHRHGGVILEIVGIKHQMEKPREGRSCDQWWFTGRVKWRDGSGNTTKLHPLDAQMLCSDTPRGQEEIIRLCALLSDYLAEHGAWYKKGPHEGWYAHRVQDPVKARHPARK